MGASGLGIIIHFNCILLLLVIIFYISNSVPSGNQKCSSLTFSVGQTVDADPVACILILAAAEIFTQPHLSFASAGRSPKSELQSLPWNT